MLLFILLWYTSNPKQKSNVAEDDSKMILWINGQYLLDFAGLVSYIVSLRS